MNNPHPISQAATVLPVAVERVQANYTVTKKLGNWTTARRFEARVRRGHAVIDLRSPHIEAGDIELDLAVDHGMVKLLLPENATVDDWDLVWQGRGRIKDLEGRRDTGGSARRVRITGLIRHGEIRVHRGGIAQLTAMFSREYVDDLRRAHAEGTCPTVDDPTRDPNRAA